jgi:acyl dehydratase
MRQKRNEKRCWWTAHLPCTVHWHKRPNRQRQGWANLGWDKVKATHPVFAGDTLYAESTVLFKRESKSRPTQGIVTVLTRGLNQDGKEVMSFERTMLI